MSIAKILEHGASSKTGNGRDKDLEESVGHMQDGLRLFRKCVGERHPLTANALGSIGKVQIKQGKHNLAASYIKDALEQEVDKDAFHVETVFLHLLS